MAEERPCYKNGTLENAMTSVHKTLKGQVNVLSLRLFFICDRVFYVAQAGLEVAILLPQPVKCWNYRCSPSV